MQKGKQKEPWVGIIIFNNNGEIVLVEKNKHQQDKLSLSIPGGRLENDGDETKQTAEECAIREVREETGIVLENIRLLEQCDNIFNEDGQEKRRGWLFIAHAKSTELNVEDKREISKTQWVNLSGIDNLPIKERFKKIILKFQQEILREIKLTHEGSERGPRL